MPRRVAIVPHTHWDREWYEPFQSFRLRLVAVVDELLDVLERDPAYRSFLLDGQMAMVDDYLEVRPEAEQRIRALAASGRVELGPWYVLMDEFLVSGETIVRDLQMGMQRAAAFGGAMEVGYLPDMFGHVAQMPQLLRLAGIDQAVVWRGVPSSVTKTAFTWEAPDGSSVRAEYLPFGYGNGALLPDDGAGLVRRVADHLAEIGPFLMEDLLLMGGSDHLPPQPALGRAVAEANALQAATRFEITTLATYLEHARGTDGVLERWRGELRSGARANMLMGVTSNRVDVKRAVGATERALEQRAEPLAALCLPATEWPGRLFELAWREVVRNAAHDSICACSVDEVGAAVLHRAAEARRIADGIADRASRRLGESMAAKGLVALNTSARARSGIVEYVVAGAGDPAPGGDGAPGRVQTVSERPLLPDTLVLDAPAARAMVLAVDGTKLDDHAWIHEVAVDEDDGGIGVTVRVGPEEQPGTSAPAARRQLLAKLAARPSAPVHVRIEQPPIRRVVARVDDVPGFGWRVVEPASLTHPVSAHARADAVELSNELATVVVDRASGTFSLDGVGGLGRIVDGGDLGDSYNYSPPAIDELVDEPESVVVHVLEEGPVRARASVRARYRWPARVGTASQRREGAQSTEITTLLELRADEAAVHMTTSFVNPSRDHRVRVHFPLPEPATHSEAESAFGTVRRELSAEGRPEERGLPTFPARRFVRAGGLTVVCDGVTEYELVDVDDAAEPARARTLALTVLRSTGMLSRLGMSYRPLPAGPLLEVEGLQMVGREVVARYALCRQSVDPWALAEDVLTPLEVVAAPGGGWRGPAGSLLGVDGAQVSAVRREAGELEVRVFNPTDEPSTVGFGGRSGWLVDLRGCPIEAFDGSFPLRAHGIATVRLAES